MSESENKQKNRLEDYEKLSRNSLVRVQYSCGGNSNGIDDEEYIPIVSNKPKTENTENEDETKNS